MKEEIKGVIFFMSMDCFPEPDLKFKKSQKNKPVKILQPDSHLRQIKTQIFANICLLLRKDSYQR